VHECGLGAGSCDGLPDPAGRREEHAAGSPVLGMMVLVTESQELPGGVLAAYERAAGAGF